MSASVRGVVTLLAVGMVVAGCGTPSIGSSSNAATVNGRAISMSNYHLEVVYKRYVASQSTGGVDVCSVKVDTPLCSKLKQTALNDLIGEELVSQYAARHHIKVTQADFNRQWTLVMVSKFHNQVPVLHAYLRHFGITEAFLRQLVRDDIMDNKVMYQVTRNMSVVVPAVRVSRLIATTQQQVGQLQSALKHGRTFNQLAQLLMENKSGTCAQNGCGDLGWIPDVFLASSEKKVLTAPIGSVVGPINKVGGAELLLVEARTRHYRLTTTEQLDLRQQVFATWVHRQIQHADVHRYVET